MSSTVDKAKKLKYLGVQFITIDDPVLEQSRMSLNCQRSNASIAKLTINNTKPNIDNLQPYPGLENSTELFTRDEITEINYSLSLGSDSKEICRFKPTSKLSLLKQVSQALHEKNDYNKSEAQDEADEINLFEKSNPKDAGESHQLKLPSTPLTRCDSLISCNGDDEAEFLQVSTRRSQLCSPANEHANGDFLSDDGKRNQNLKLSQDEIQNQIWIYAHDPACPNVFSDSKESNVGEITTKSLPAGIPKETKSGNDQLSKDNNTTITKSNDIDNTNKKDKSNDNNNLNNNCINNDNKKNSANMSNVSNNKQILNKSHDYQNKKKGQTRKSSLLEHNLSYLNKTHVQPINGSIVNGRTQVNLNSGEKRLKKIIAMSAPKETITPDFQNQSILKTSYCARKVYKYLKDSAVPLPTFLQEESDGDADL